MSYQIDVLRDGNGNIIRPATVSDNVVVPSSGKSVTEELQDAKDIVSESVEDGFAIVDSENRIGLKYDADGLDAAKVSEHFRSLVGGGSDVPSSGVVPLCFENGFFVVDNENRVGMKYNAEGLDVARLSSHFLSLIGSSSSIIPGDNSGQEIMNLKQPTKSGGSAYVATLGIISDIHADGDNLATFINYCNYYGFTNMLHLGDTTYEYNYGKSTSYSFWNNVTGSNKVMNVVGNHDSRTTSGGWTGQTQQVVYDCIINPFVTTVNPVQPEDAETNGLNYYYKDLNNYVRLICLDCMFWGQDQYDWLSGVLDDSLANSKHVLIAVHYPTNDIDLADSSFNCRVAGAKIIDTSVGGNSYLDRYEPTNVSDLVQTYINNGGTFIAWMCGHQHRNWLGWLKRNPNQLQLCVPSSRKDYSTPTYAYELGNVNQHCFSLISIDAYSKIFKLLRIGKRNDTYMQYQKQFCYNYNTRTIVYSD